MRYSKQREIIYELLKGTTVHPDADWVYSRVREIIPDISLGTVYRDLKQLVESGMVLSLETQSGVVHYDANVLDHTHFVCKKCGLITDEGASEGREALEKNGFLVEAEKHIFYGVCAKCNQNKNNGNKILQETED